MDLSSNAGVMSHRSLASPAPTYKSRSRISSHSKKASSFIPVLVPRHRSKVDAGSILSEAVTCDLQVNEPQNIIKGDLAVNHGKEDCKLVKLIDSRSSNKDVEVGCTRITDDVEGNKEIAETSLRVNHGFEFRMTAPDECIFESEPISAHRKDIRETSGHGESNFSRSLCTESVNSDEFGGWYSVSGFEKCNSATRRNPEFANINGSAVIQLSKLMESTVGHAVELRSSSSNFDNIQCKTTFYGNKEFGSRWQASLSGRQSKSTIDEDAIEALMETHQEFIHVMKSRKTKLEEACRCWRGNDRELLGATLRMSDCAVTADIIIILMKNNNCITLDTCTSLLHLASSLFESTYDRHLSIAMEVVLKLVKSFGATISSTLLAAPPVGVDIEGEQRLERCDLCFRELKKVSASLISLTRRHGEVGRSAQELSVFLQDMFQLSSM